MSKVDKKMAIAEREKQLQQRFGQASGTGPNNRHGMPQVPPNQRVVTNWPVLDLGDQPQISLDRWNLTVDGLVDTPLDFNWEQFMALPQTEDVSDFHCVTGWSRMDNRWVGVKVKELAERASLQADVTHLVITAYDMAPGTDIPYTTNVPIDQALEEDVLLVHQWEGGPLPIEHGGPVRMITPKLWAWKGAKWVRKLTFTNQDHPGFWEVRGYSNTAEPWYDDRYSY